jgi:hypothetical protein
MAPGRMDGASVRTPAPAAPASREGPRRFMSHAHTVSCVRTMARAALSPTPALLRPLYTHTHTGGPNSCSKWLLQMSPTATCATTRSTFATSR